MNPPTEISTMGPKARVPYGTLTRLALPVGAYRQGGREGQEAATTCDPTSRRWAPGEAAWERSLRVQRYSYVLESAGETCRVEPA
jgi:hypothetical protein